MPERAIRVTTMPLDLSISPTSFAYRHRDSHHQLHAAYHAATTSSVPIRRIVFADHTITTISLPTA